MVTNERRRTENDRMACKGIYLSNAFSNADDYVRSRLSAVELKLQHSNRRRSPEDFSSVLNSPQAVAMSVYIVRAFIQQREVLAANKTILKRLAEIDKTLLQHNAALRDIYQKLLPLLQPPPEPPRPKIGFRETKARYGALNN